MKKDAAISIDKFISDQLSVWPEVSAAFRNLKSATVRSMNVGGLEVVLQHNPARIISSTARIDKEYIESRPCFLCEENCPPEQMRVRFEGRKGRAYSIQVNPYPIFPEHLVIVSKRHSPQSIWHHFVDMLDLAKAFQGRTFFYNGPCCGASAPDHMHFQACPAGLMPLENAIDALLESFVPGKDDDGRHYDVPGRVDYLLSANDASLYHYTGFTRGVFVLRAKTSKSMAKLFYRLLDAAPVAPGEQEPKFNLFSYFKNGEYRTFLTFRQRHFSHHYCSDGPDSLTMGLGCADMAGFFIVPVEQDFKKLNPELLTQMLDEVSISPEDEEKMLWKLSRRQPKINVGIMSAREIVFEIISDGVGPQKVSFREGRIDYNGVLYDELMFDAATKSTVFAEPSFILHDVTIGVDFHWERKVSQTFAGSLRFIVEGDKITAVNNVGVEDYLLSVISSEMKSSASLEFLKAHAVISRSWVMSRIKGKKGNAADLSFRSVSEDGTPEYIRWFDQEDHTNFDVCADDHCQRYQGLSMAVGDTVRQAIDETWGEVLTYDGNICDARFSKCCGGVMETFGTCWDDSEHPYLKAIPDTPGEEPGGDVFCNTSDTQILSQVLNDYDLETKDFYRWEVRYTQEYLSELVARRSGEDFGTILDLIPIARGGSGRIYKLKVVGEKQTMVIGKELIIRRWLSESHLKSSAFDVSRDGTDFILRGSGWGHGVGLCQIGAAVMSFRGYGYRSILSHYYPGSVLQRQ